MYPAVEAYLAARAGEFDRIDAERRAALEKLAGYVRQERAAGRVAKLTFVCTHNSRRSHMAQIWAAAAARDAGVRVTTYSGGTEVTAFNPRAVAAVERAGAIIEKTTDDTNPIYHVRLGADAPALTCFSKKYDTAPNPATGFAAVMVCDSADQACPVVPGAARFAITYVDPKASDGTPGEGAAYDERCAQIAREMLWMMRRAAD